MHITMETVGTLHGYQLRKFTGNPEGVYFDGYEPAGMGMTMAYHTIEELRSYIETEHKNWRPF